MAHIQALGSMKSYIFFEILPNLYKFTTNKKNIPWFIQLDHKGAYMQM